MIHDATIEVTCDRDDCCGHEFFRYDSSDKAVEKALVVDHEWVVIDGRHYCSAECAQV